MALDDNKVTKVYNAIVNKTNALIGSHDSNSSAHSTIMATKVNKSDITDNVNTNDATKPLSAKQGKELNDKVKNIINFFNGQRITLTGNTNSISENESCTLTATLVSADNVGKTVQLYIQTGATQNPSNDTLIGTMTDNNNGTYTKVYTSTGAGDVYFYAKLGNIMSEVYHITDIIKLNTVLSLSPSAIEGMPPFTFYGTLTANNIGLENKIIKVMEVVGTQTTFVENKTTDNNGQIQFTTNSGDYSVYFVFEGDDEYNSSESNRGDITVEFDPTLDL